MVNIYDNDGVIILDSEEFSLKIDKSRKIYVKRNENKNFETIGHEVPIGYSTDQKKRYLYDLYRMIIKKSKE